MSNNDNHTTSPGEESIRPAQVTLNVNPAPSTHNSSNTKSAWQEHRFLIFGIGLGAMLLIAVIFVLPNKVTVNVDEDAIAEIENTAPAAPGPAESPWRDQQFGKERREAQEILAKLRAKQDQLEAIKVWEWAEADYAEAKSHAEQADLEYRQQEFLKAQAGYNQTLTSFDALLQRATNLYSESIATGEQAILDGDDNLAKESFALATTLKPNDDIAEKGLQRAEVLAQVIAHVTDGKQLQRENQLEQAKEKYLAALALDSESVIAKNQITSVDNAIRDRNFGQQMSLGYAAINNQQYQQAISAFKKASAIKPNASDAQSALVQAENEATLATIANHIKNAENFEANEQWQQALDEFNSALALDNTVVAARVGSIRTQARADIDTKLQGIIDNPQRLTTASVYQEFQEYLKRTKALPNPGPRLQDQITKLDNALVKAVEPVQVRFVSDNQTQVTLYRVEDMGLFSEKQLTLKPGNYTVVGKRNGYRDVRREFSVSADAQQNTVTIQCEEKIPTG